MKVIVSTTLEDSFINFKVVKSIKDAMAIDGVDTLILHTFADQDFEAGILLAKFHKMGVSEVVYINNDPHMIIKMVVQGVKGYIVTDEFYLDDEDELVECLKDLGINKENQETSLALVSAKVVKEFIEAFARGEDKINTPAYLAQVNQAIDELSDLTYKQELQINKMGSSAIEIFEKASGMIKQLSSNTMELQSRLAALQESNEESASKAMVSSVSFFPTVRYMGTNKLLLIRELSPCRYLTSFILGYFHHLKYGLNRRVKLVFVVQKGQRVLTKYTTNEDFYAITQDSMQVKSLYDGEIIVTNSPKNEVMKEIFSKNRDVLIVVDRLYSKTDIVDGRVIRVNAVSGNSDVDRFKIKPEDTIFSTATNFENCFYCIPTVKQYAMEKDLRFAQYEQLCGDVYTKMDKLIDVLDK